MAFARRLTLLALAAVLVGCASFPSLRRDSVTVTPIARGLYVLGGTYANLLVSIGPDGVLLVDDDLPESTRRLERVIRRLGGKPPTFILNTHWHADHTAANPHFAAKGSTIIAHENVRRRLSTEQTVSGEPLDPEGWPLVTFDDAITLHFNGETIRVRHYPHAHTDGDAVVFFTEANVVHLGDLMFEGMYPKIDLASGGDCEGLIRSLEVISRELTSDTIVVPGHGAPRVDRIAVREFLALLYDTLVLVADGVNSFDQDVDEIVEQGMPEQWRALDSVWMPEERYLRTFYKCMTRDPIPRSDLAQ